MVGRIVLRIRTDFKGFSIVPILPHVFEFIPDPICGDIGRDTTPLFESFHGGQDPILTIPILSTTIHLYSAQNIFDRRQLLLLRVANMKATPIFIGQYFHTFLGARKLEVDCVSCNLETYTKVFIQVRRFVKRKGLRSKVGDCEESPM
jgi:hypothetical protein